MALRQNILKLKKISYRKICQLHRKKVDSWDDTISCGAGCETSVQNITVRLLEYVAPPHLRGNRKKGSNASHLSVYYVIWSVRERST